MYPNSIYLGSMYLYREYFKAKVHILFGYMDPQGRFGDLGLRLRVLGLGLSL